MLTYPNLPSSTTKKAIFQKYDSINLSTDSNKIRFILADPRVSNKGAHAINAQDNYDQNKKHTGGASMVYCGFHIETLDGMRLVSPAKPVTASERS